MTNRANPGILKPVIAVLALADGVLHLALDFVLFRGNLFGGRPPSGPQTGTLPSTPTPRPAPGGNPLILPLNELFVLNFVGAVVLVLLFWFSRRLLGERRWLVDVALIVYAAAAFGAWLLFGRPNPMGLGYLSKGIEIVLVITLIADIWSILRPRGLAAQAT